MKTPFSLLFACCIVGMVVAAEVEVDSAIERAGINGNVWESQGSVFIHPRGSSSLEVINGQGSSSWLDVSLLVEGTSFVETAARINDGYLVSGILGSQETEMFHGFLVFDADGTIVEKHVLGRIGEDGSRIQKPRAIHIMSALDVGNGEVALFWSGFRGNSEIRQHGVTLFKAETWQMIDDVYGPVDLPTHMTGHVSLRSKFCQVRRVGEQLVVVDAHKARLALIPISNIAGAIEIDLLDDDGNKAPVVGWWISPSGKEVHILYLNEEQGQTRRRLMAITLNGEEKNRRPFKSPSRLILPTDTMHALILRENGKIEKARIH